MTTFRTIEPYLYYPDGRAALDWLQETFGWGETYTTESDGQVAEGSIRVGDAYVHVSAGRAAEDSNGKGALNIVTVDDVDTLYEHIRSTGIDLDPPKDENYGPRTINVTDPWGYRWYFWQGHAVY